MDMREEPGSCKTPVDDLIIKAVTHLTPPLIAFLVFLPTLGYDFVSWDDAQYVYENPAIRSLEPSSLWHIFTTTDLTKWHPLTIVSFAVDYAVWGLDPRGFHLTNTLLHALNTLLVVVIVGRLCTLSGLKSRGVLATAFITALIFSVHPLRVESVAWVTERKDVLYGAFYLLSILAYTSYAAPATKDRWRAKAAYLLSLTLFGLASMSKPMAVTLPVVLLILDFYPLKRLGDSAIIYVEKVPFFLISLFTGVMILRANLSLDTAPGFAELPLYERVLNAAHSCVFYLWKTFVPTGLAPFYPPAEDVLTPAYFASAAAIIMISALCVWLWIFAKKGSRLYLTLWLYYLVTLVPVLGFVQVGSQAAADRFTYMASLGPALLAALGVTALLERYQSRAAPRPMAAVAASALAAFGALCYLTVSQAGIWRNTITLWTHQIELYPAKEGWSHPGYLNRASALMEAGRFSEALPDFDMAARVDPADPGVYNGRAKARAALGQVRSAVDDYSTAIGLDPGNIEAYLNRAVVFTFLRDYERAARDYETALKLTPGNKDTYRRLAEAYMRLGREDLAREVIMRGKRAR